MKKVLVYIVDLNFLPDNYQADVRDVSNEEFIRLAEYTGEGGYTFEQFQNTWNLAFENFIENSYIRFIEVEENYKADTIERNKDIPNSEDSGAFGIQERFNNY